MDQKLSLLVVDDSEAGAQALASALSTAWSVSSRRVADPDAFRDALARAPWDVILCCHRTAHFGAMPALRILLESGQDIPFIIVAGSITSEEAGAALKLGAHGFITPDDLGPLVAVVAEQLRDAEARRQRPREDRAVRESGTFARAIVESLSEPLLTFDPAGHVESFNPAAERLFRRRREEVVGRHVGMIFERPLVELVARAPDGEQLPLQVTVSDTNVGGRHVFIVVARVASAA